MKRVLVVVIVIVSITRSIGQEMLVNEVLPDIEWGEGSIMLK